MPRNLDTRVELLAPVRDDELRADLLDTLERCFADDTNAWELGQDGTWTRRDADGPGAAQRPARADDGPRGARARGRRRRRLERRPRPCPSSRRGRAARRAGRPWRRARRCRPRRRQVTTLAALRAQRAHDACPRRWPRSRVARPVERGAGRPRCRRSAGRPSRRRRCGSRGPGSRRCACRRPSRPNLPDVVGEGDAGDALLQQLRRRPAPAATFGRRRARGGGARRPRCPGRRRPARRRPA